MNNTREFLLPDLGEGLPDAEIVEWKVKLGDVVCLDDPLVAMETAKAVVDVPSPFSGTVLRLYGAAGDVIETGKPLAAFELNDGPQRAAGHDTGHHHGAAPAASASAYAPTRLPEAPVAPPAPRSDSGTVVGSVVASDALRSDAVVESGGIRAMPAVRAQAKKLGIDLKRIRGTGALDSITMDDLRRFAAQEPTQTQPRVVEPAPRYVDTAATAHPAARPATSNASADSPARPGSSASGPRSGPASAPASQAASGAEPLRGVRRNMARTMSAAHAEVVPTTLMDDADIHQWQHGQDITVRLIRAMVAGARAEPALNAWFDGKAGTRTLHQKVDVGIAVDTPDGLFVPALRNADVLDAAQLRTALNRLREQVKQRAIPAEDLSGYTLMLSNFGIYAGRYATPIVVPPCVCILGAGKLRYEAVPVMGSIAAHRMIPLSLTFDHRACTGGEAARFLRAMLDDLARPS